MIKPGVVFLLISAVLLAVAILSHVSSTTLSLPVAPGITILTILLPVAGAINTFYFLYQHRAAQNSQLRLEQLRLEQLLPTIFQVLQGVITTVLATLLLQDTIPDTVLECGLSTQWQRLFQSHNEEAIKRIQDTLQCCGFNSVKDRAWPFPSKNGPTCVDISQRSTACVGPWRASMQRNAGMDLGVVFGVAVIQAAILFLARSARRGETAWWGQGWKPASNVEDSPRPLLQGPVEDDDDTNDQEAGTQAPRRLQYDTMGNGGGPRVEPSSLERNEWTQEGESH